MTKKWPWDWSENVANLEKRNIVVADDAAFREKSKLLTAMERQKWLNSYIQKLLVVNSK
ncbi:TIP39 protein, partial [Polypterus senegalus]|nr:TIP39 protein [Polypterus senegalus]